MGTVVRSVVVKNLLGQSQKIGVYNGTAVDEKTIVAYGSYGPVAQSLLTAYTHGLVAKGYLQLVPVE